LNQNALLEKAVFLVSKGELILPGRVREGAEGSMETPSLSKNWKG